MLKTSSRTYGLRAKFIIYIMSRLYIRHKPIKFQEKIKGSKKCNSDYWFWLKWSSVIFATIQVKILKTFQNKISKKFLKFENSIFLSSCKKIWWCMYRSWSEWRGWKCQVIIIPSNISSEVKISWISLCCSRIRFFC